MKKGKFCILLAFYVLMLSLTACQSARPGDGGAGLGREAAAALEEAPRPYSPKGSGKAVEEGQEGDTTGTDIAAGASGQPGGQAGETPEALKGLEIHFLDVGQGDCTLLLCGGEAMLIDAGDNNQGTKIQNYLQKRNVEALKYVVCTHPDEDHIGGMDVILYKFDCGTILMTEENKDTNTYRDVVDTMENKGYQRSLPVVGQQYSLGDASFTVLAPAGMADGSNNNSIALLVTHGGNRFLFTGDAEEGEEADMVDSGIMLDADVYKAGHHGSRTSSSEALLEAVSPKYAVVSCGEGNSYGHPHAETLDNFRARGIQVFRTDEQGSIVLSSDGEIRWNCSPSGTWQPGEPSGPSESPLPGEPLDPPEAWQETGVAQEPVLYIYNTNTGKFHHPDCASVKQMKEENKLPVSTEREELVNQGYVPCKNCNP